MCENLLHPCYHAATGARMDKPSYWLIVVFHDNLPETPLMRQIPRYTYSNHP